MRLWLFVVGMCTFAAPSLAEDGAWFGVSSLEQRRQEREGLFKATFVDLGLEPLSLRLPAEDPYQDIRGETIHRYVREIVAISEESRLAGDRLWGRISGTPYERMAAEYVQDRLREFGLSEVWMEEFPRGPQWWPTHWELKLLADPSFGEGTRDVVFATAFPASPSPSAPEGSLEAELIYVGLGRPADLVGRDLRGKVAVLHSIPQPSVYSHTGRGVPERLAALGAIAVLTVIDVPADVQFMAVGAGSARVPSFTLSGDEGAFLEEVIARAGGSEKLKVRIELAVEQREGWTAQNVFGLVPGASEEYVILTAHLDAYFYGANDNASGVATLLSLAQHFSRDEAPTPRRNLLFIATAGHHAPSLQGGRSVGVANVIANHAELLPKTVLVLNCEHTAAIATLRRQGGIIETNTENPRHLAVTNRSPLLLEFLREAFDRYGVVVATQTNHVPSGDPMRFQRAGLTVINLIEAGVWYHSTGDLPETIPAAGLERTARAFAYFLDKVDHVSRPEIEKSSVAQSGL